MKLYKLTNSKNQTRGGTKWGKNKRLDLIPCQAPQLCSDQVIHAYKTIPIALLLNPIHGGFKSPNLWEAEGDIVVEDYGKVGCFNLTTIKRLKKPDWYLNKNKKQKIQTFFSILCAGSVLSVWEAQYPKDKRPRQAIKAAKEYLKTKNADAARAAAYDAARAADAAARAAAYAAAYAADAAAAAAAAAAYDAATAAADTARAAADAADIDKKELDFTRLADKAIKIINKK
jgi:hypothetical protein